MTSRNELVIGAVLLMAVVIGGCNPAAGIGLARLTIGIGQFTDEVRMEDELNSTIAQYRQEAGKVRIGDPKDTVLSILSPAQNRLRNKLQKSSESYREGESLVEIYYFRTNWVGDRRVTDDEFTPYIFRDGVLTSIGWRLLGGPKTFSGILVSEDFDQPRY